jgi:tetratricopeptide (TPR) repeat protein
LDYIRRALAVTQEARFKYERFGTAYILSVVHRIWLAQSSAQLGLFPEAKRLADDAISIAQEACHASSLAFSNMCLGFVHLLQGNVESAIVALEKSLNICDANNIQVFMPHIGSNLAYAYALAGRFGDAIPLMEKIDDQSKLSRRKAAWGLRLAWLGHASLLGRRIAKAREQGTRAVTLASDARERGNEAWARKLLGDIGQQDSSNHAEAFDQYTVSMALATELAMRPLQAHIHFGLGRLHCRENQLEKARTELSLALTSYRSIEMPFWIDAAKQELSTLVN